MFGRPSHVAAHIGTLLLQSCAVWPELLYVNCRARSQACNARKASRPDIFCVCRTQHTILTQQKPSGLVATIADVSLFPEVFSCSALHNDLTASPSGGLLQKK